jgi:chemotaxis signal transduction protein
MAIYLQIRAGGVHLLLDALKVHEVMGLDTVQPAAQGHVQWRDDVLHYVDLAAFLRRPADAPSMAVVYSPDDEALPLMLAVDEVLGLRDLAATDFRALPRIPADSAAFFDAVWLEPAQERQSFRLRHPIAAQVFQGVDGAEALVEESGQD